MDIIKLRKFIKEKKPTLKELQFILLLSSEDRYFQKHEVIKELWDGYIADQTFHNLLQRLKHKGIIYFYQKEKGYKRNF